MHRAPRRRARARRRRRLILPGLLALALIGVVAAMVAARSGGTHAAASTAPPPEISAARAPAPPPHPAATAPQHLAFPATPAHASVRVPVLMFHRVATLAGPTTAVERDLTVAPAVFRAQMDWLAANGYHPITQARLFRALYLGDRLPRRPVVLTFDDGYVDAVTTILPVLQKRRWPATFFVITGRAGARAFLTWPQMAALDRAGMDVSSHTVDHVELPGLSPEQRMRELRDSRRALEHHLGHPVYWFAYPAGRFDAASGAAVRQAGYLLAYTTAYGSTISSATPMSEPRVRVRGEGSVAEFAAAVAAAGR